MTRYRYLKNHRYETLKRAIERQIAADTKRLSRDKRKTDKVVTSIEPIELTTIPASRPFEAYAMRLTTCLLDHNGFAVFKSVTLFVYEGS